MNDNDAWDILIGPAGEEVFDLVMENRRLKQLITALQDELRWRPVEEKPGKAGAYLVRCSDREIRFYTVAYYYDGFGWDWNNDYVTDWRPLSSDEPQAADDNPTVASFRRAWEDVLAGRVYPIEKLWDEGREDEVLDILASPFGEAIRDLLLENGHLKKTVEGLETRLLEFSQANNELALLNADLQIALTAAQRAGGERS